jgi:phosphoglucosamine mutase
VLRFGTDGVRGVANAELTPELVLALGRAAARVLGSSSSEGASTFVVGRDTRRSGPLLQAALAAGLASEGADVVDLGVLPTPGVAHVSASRGLPAAVLSASHNPFPDNGIKLFAAGGRKLDDATEDRLEAELARILEAGSGPLPTGAAVGTLLSDPSGLAEYGRHLLSCLEGRRLVPLRVVLDCAHGAAVTTAPDAFRAAGAEVLAVIGDAPDGQNINRACGSTDPSALARAVVELGADAGLAFDGDADRLIAVDAEGQVVDGDRILALFATDLAERQELGGNTVVVTVMTNLGFHHAMEAAGIAVHQTQVGDRYVLEALEANGWALGGEQSGHIVFRSLATTGDGVLSALLLLDLVARRGRPLADLAAQAMRRLPQVLRNVAVSDRDGLADAQEVWAEVAGIERDLGHDGRVLLRASGTEQLVRVMVEARTQAEAEVAAERLATVVARSLGGGGIPVSAHQ